MSWDISGGRTEGPTLKRLGYPLVLLGRGPYKSCRPRQGRERRRVRRPDGSTTGPGRFPWVLWVRVIVVVVESMGLLTLVFSVQLSSEKTTGSAGGGVGEG